MIVYLYFYYTAIFTAPVLSWQYFTSLKEIELQPGNSEENMMTTSEYQFGNCRRKYAFERQLYTHIHVPHMKILGKLIYRAYLDNVKRIPTCIIMKGRASKEYEVKGMHHNFQVCVPRVSFIHDGFRFDFFYLEWYLPNDLSYAHDYDFYFYGPDPAIIGEGDMEW